MKKHNIYDKYDDYVSHQKIKTLDPKRREEWIKEWNDKVSIFSSIFNEHINIIRSCSKALCVCARVGHEVKALQDIGLDSIGIDLVPFDPYVIFGDMHNIPFNDNSFDFVFCNSFDHSLYPNKFIEEIERILKPNGYCFLILQTNTSGDKYSENEITSSADVISLFHKSSIIVNEPFTISFFCYNWKIILKKSESIK